MEQVTNLVAKADREWKRLGVLPTTRLDLAAELTADLTAAVADGREARDVVGSDVERFARDWAYARGDVPVRAYYGRAFAAAALGLIGGGIAAIGLIALLAAGSEFFRNGHGVNFDNGGTSLLIAYLVAGLGAYLGALGGTSTGLSAREDPFARRTVTTLSWTLAVGIAVALGLGVGTAASLHYPASFHLFVVTEVVLVLSVLAPAVVLARRLAVGMPSVLAGPGQSASIEPLDVSL